jgi:hypothetical protein
VEVHPRMPSSPAKTEVVARLSPGAHRTQSRRRLSAKLAVAEQTLQHAATHHHHHCGRPHRSTSRRVASRQTRSRRSSDEKARTPGAAAPASSSSAGSGLHAAPSLPDAGAATSCPRSGAKQPASASIDRGPPGPGRAQIGSARSRQPQRPPTAPAALSGRATPAHPSPPPRLPQRLRPTRAHRPAREPRCAGNATSSRRRRSLSTAQPSAPSHSTCDLRRQPRPPRRRAPRQRAATARCRQPAPSTTERGEREPRRRRRRPGFARQRPMAAARRGEGGAGPLPGG